MTTDEIAFYLRHRRQITEWAALEGRVHDLLRDTVAEGSVDKAAQLLAGESGDDEVDFYVRNRSLITQWDALQVPAGHALHQALLSAARDAGCPATEHRRGWTSARARSPELDALFDDWGAWVEFAWTKQDLLSTRRGYRFPRVALLLPPNRWQGDVRAGLIKGTRAVARELGMNKKGGDWWTHWRMLDEISDSQDVESYAAECVTQFRNTANSLCPVLREVISAPEGSG